MRKWVFGFENFWESGFTKWHIDFLTIIWTKEEKLFTLFNFCFRWYNLG